MSSRRKLIRQKVKELLTGNVSEVGSNIFTNQASPRWQENLPAIVIHSLNEDLDTNGTSPKEYIRSFKMLVEIIASGPEDPYTADGEPLVEDLLDDIGEKVEDHLSRNDALGDFTDLDGKIRCLADRTDVLNVEYQFEPDGEKIIGSLRITFVVEYSEHRPRSIDLQNEVAQIEDLTQVHVDYSVGHHDEEADDVNEAEDDITLDPPS